MEVVQVNAWDRRPDETDKAWGAFQEYLNMPLMHPDRLQRRSYSNLMMRLNYKSETTIQGWARKYQWRSRARAHDIAMGVRAEEMRLGSIDELVQYTLQSTGEQLVKFNEVINGQLVKMQEDTEAGESIRPIDLKNIIEAMKTKDDLMRRIARMPTDFRTETVEDENVEEAEIFIVGGK